MYPHRPLTTSYIAGAKYSFFSSPPTTHPTPPLYSSPFLISLSLSLCSLQIQTTIYIAQPIYIQHLHIYLCIYICLCIFCSYWSLFVLFELKIWHGFKWVFFAEGRVFSGGSPGSCGGWWSHMVEDSRKDA